jgi:hypothetical protein
MKTFAVFLRDKRVGFASGRTREIAEYWAKLEHGHDVVLVEINR